MTDKRLRPPLDGSAYNGFASGPGDHADPRPGAPRPPVPNYPLPEFRQPRRRRSSWLGPTLLSLAVLVAAGLLAYAVLRAEQGGPLPWATPRPAPASQGTAAPPRLEAALRATIPPGVERTADSEATPRAIAPPPDGAAPVAEPARPPASEAPRPEPRTAGPRVASTAVAQHARAPQPKAVGGCDARPAGMARLRCRDPQLASLDHELNAAFADAVRAGAPAGPLGDEQEAWVIRRDRAARDAPDTVADLYQERIAKLREQGQQAR